MHLYMLAYMFMHESCLLVCHPCFSTMKLWTFDPNLHLSLADTTFYLLSCFFVLSFVCFLFCFFACHVYHDYLLYASFICSLHLFLPLLVCWFLVFAFAWYTYGARTHGAKAWSPRHKQKGRGCEHVDISQAAMFSSFRSLASPIWFCKIPSFLLHFSLRWVVLGISCHVPFVLISRVWRPLFTFLHLYFGPCFRDVGIYFPTLYACIVPDVYIYLFAPSGVIVTVHVI